MPITEFLDGYNFDRETRRVMGLAYEMAYAALKFENQTYLAQETIAKRIIALAKDGVVDPNQLCDQTLIGLCKPQPIAWEVAPLGNTGRSGGAEPPRPAGARA